ncbi:MAG: hypothetical protein M1338_01485 [Patescibacteria group bacterium]|nr:hypothetical protein [Patescibacteria group bacterium]
MPIVKNKLITKIFAFISLVLIFSFLFLPYEKIFAASLTSVSDTATRLKKNTLSNHTITFVTPTGVGAGETITVTFPSDFIGEAGIDYTDVDANRHGVDLTLAATPSGTTWGAAFSDSGSTRNKLTITSDTGTIVGGHTIIIKIGTNATGGDKQMTNATTAGSYTVALTSGASDSGSYALAISDEDQVVITASVDPYLSFNVTDGTVALGTLSPLSVKTDTAAMTAATNSTSGYSITVNGPTLTSGANTITAIGAVAAASNPGTEQFGFKVGAAGGSGSAVSPYDTANYAFDTASLPDEVAHSAGVSDTTTYTLTYIANIANTTEPGSYTATHTYICTGNF